MDRDPEEPDSRTVITKKYIILYKINNSPVPFLSLYTGTDMIIWSEVSFHIWNSEVLHIK